MFRRFIATWLMLSILGYGMAVTADVQHETAAQSGTHSHLLADADAPTDHPDQTADSDHCCHGVVHLLGLSQESSPAQVAGSCVPSVLHTEQLYSLSLTPAFRPPIAA
jgi:hypothetical protein